MSSAQPPTRYVPADGSSDLSASVDVLQFADPLPASLALVERLHGLTGNRELSARWFPCLSITEVAGGTDAVFQRRRGVPLSEFLQARSGPLAARDALGLGRHLAETLDVLVEASCLPPGLGMESLRVASFRRADGIAGPPPPDGEGREGTDLFVMVDVAHAVHRAGKDAGKALSEPVEDRRRQAMAFLARLIYRLIVGREAPYAAQHDTKAYRPFQKLGAEANSVLAHAIAGREQGCVDCRSLVTRLEDEEKLPRSGSAGFEIKRWDDKVEAPAKPPPPPVQQPPATPATARPRPVRPKSPSRWRAPLFVMLAFGAAGLAAWGVMAWMPFGQEGGGGEAPPRPPASETRISRNFELRLSPSTAEVLIQGEEMFREGRLGDGIWTLPVQGMQPPLTLSVSAPGHEAVRLTLETEKDIADLAPIRLKRLRGKFRVVVPEVGSNYSEVVLNWKNALPGEEGHVRDQPVQVKFVSETAEFFHPTGVYEVTLKAGKALEKHVMARAAGELTLETAQRSGPQIELPPSVAGEFRTAEGVPPLSLTVEENLGQLEVRGDGVGTLPSGPLILMATHQVQGQFQRPGGGRVGFALVCDEDGKKLIMTGGGLALLGVKGDALDFHRVAGSGSP